MTSGAPTPAELFAEFRRQVRLTDHDVDPTLVSERDGLVRRSYPEDPAADGAMIESPEGLGASDGEIARSIAAQVAFFRGRGQRVEWKTYADDEPADLVARLVEAGFVAEDEEVVLLGRAADLTSGATAPAGIRVREFSSPLDWERVRTLKDSVWGAEHTWVIDAMREEQAREPALLRSVLAEEVDGECRVVSYATLRLTRGSDFAGLWGGTTLASHRGHGLYRALTAYRAGVALAAGSPYVRVDTSPDSRPILTRLGLHAVTTTTPCVLTP
ncbi:MAG: hypothetical protein KBB39_16220 [Phycicoccus sp.]|nr:hypothetical protein [Phycicoccus sp.]